MSRTPRRVVAVAYDGVQLLDLAGPLDVFDAANRLRARPEYELMVASATTGSALTSSGLRLGTDPTSDVSEVHTLVVPGALDRRLPDDRPGLVGEIARLAARARRVTSVCTGAFLLAEAGVLDGRSATTHWSACEDLASEHPAVHVEPDRIFVRDGPVWTAGGVTSGIDLALALVADDLGDPVARAVAKWLLVFLQRPGGQSQFSVRSAMPPVDAPQVRLALDSIAADPAADHAVPRLAELVGVSRRHFARLFREQTGTTPARFVESVRVERACALLENTELGLEAVARAAGFGSAESMRQCFHRVLGVAPGAHRSRFVTASTETVTSR